MKNIIFVGCLFLTSFLFYSCEKEGVTMYEESPAIYFSETSRSYTFIENIEQIKIGFDTVKVPLQISGSAMDYLRKVKMIVASDDTLHTATDDMFSFGEGIVEAKQFKGYIPVRVNYSSALDDSVYSIRLRLVPNDDFPGVDLLQRTFTLSVTNKLTSPSNWWKLMDYFGAYSNSWYQFILETTGLSSLPYWCQEGSIGYGNPDPEKWTMTLYEVKAYAAQVRVALEDYNRKHPNDKLTHHGNAGKNEGKEVKMP